jgi:hypothetical protein
MIDHRDSKSSIVQHANSGQTFETQHSTYEYSPQMQQWTNETLDNNLTFAERMEKAKWEARIN